MPMRQSGDPGHLLGGLYAEGFARVNQSHRWQDAQ